MEIMLNVPKTTEPVIHPPCITETITVKMVKREIENFDKDIFRKAKIIIKVCSLIYILLLLYH